MEEYEEYGDDNSPRVDELSKISDIKKLITNGEEYYDSIYSRCKEDLLMANGTTSGQYGEADEKIRGKNRAQFTFPVLDKYVERVIGNYNLSPFGIDYTAFNSEMSNKATVMNAVVAGIEARSKAKAIYRSALRSSTTVGYGFIHAITNYNNPEDDSMDVSVEIEYIQDYSSVLQDPLSTALDGSDAQWRAHVTEMPLKEAKRIYGDDVDMYTDEGGLFEPMNQYDTDTESIIKLCTIYEKQTKKSMIWVDADGTVSEEKIENARSKEKVTTFIKCTKIIGNKILMEEDLETKRIPIVPVYGLPMYEDGRPQYVGIIHRAKDAQRLLNYAASMSAERLALSAKANYIASERAIGKYREQWANSSRSNQPVLIFEDIDANGQPIMPPMKQDTAVNVSDVLPMTAAFNQTISSVIGMSSEGIGGEGHVQETAEAALLKAKASETILSTLYENLACSIEEVGRVIMEMVAVNYDTARAVPMTEKGSTEMAEVDFPALNIIPNEYEVAITAGPLLATQRKENSRSLLAVATLLGPNAVQIMPEIIDTIDLGDATDSVKQKVEAIAQMSAQQAQGDPMAAQKLQMMTQENDKLRQETQALRQQVLQSQVDTQSTQMKIQADLLKTDMNNEAKMDLQRLKDGDTMMLNEQKADHEADKLIMEERLALTSRMAEIDAEIDAQNDINNQLMY
jgi:hypothetical protein